MAPLFTACSEAKSVKAAGKTAPQAAMSADGELEGGDTEPGEELSLEQIFKQCGVDPRDLEDPDKVLFEKTIRSWPKVFSGSQAAPIVGNVNYRVSVTTIITIKATSGSSEQSVDFEIAAVPSQAEGPAREKTAPNRGNTVSTLISTDERAELIGSNPEWEGIFCTLQPTRELSTNKGGKGKVIRFDPPLPGSVSPMADPARYEAEIGQGRTFTNIKAKVISSSDDALSEGDTFKGTVTVTPVNPTLTIRIGSASTKTVQADSAYKMTWDFGSKADTVALGLVPEQIMYIDHGDHDIKAIVADTGFEEGGTVVLVDGL